MSARAHFKSGTQAKPFSGFEIFRVYDQFFLIGFGVIPTFRAKSF